MHCQAQALPVVAAMSSLEMGVPAQCDAHRATPRSAADGRRAAVGTGGPTVGSVSVSVIQLSRGWCTSSCQARLPRLPPHTNGTTVSLTRRRQIGETRGREGCCGRGRAVASVPLPVAGTHASALDYGSAAAETDLQGEARMGAGRGTDRGPGRASGAPDAPRPRPRPPIGPRSRRRARRRCGMGPDSKPRRISRPFPQGGPDLSSLPPEERAEAMRMMQIARRAEERAKARDGAKSGARMDVEDEDHHGSGESSAGKSGVSNGKASKQVLGAACRSVRALTITTSRSRARAALVDRRHPKEAQGGGKPTPAAGPPTACLARARPGCSPIPRVPSNPAPDVPHERAAAEAGSGAP